MKKTMLYLAFSVLLLATQVGAEPSETTDFYCEIDEGLESCRLWEHGKINDSHFVGRGGWITYKQISKINTKTYHVQKLKLGKLPLSLSNSIFNGTIDFVTSSSIDLRASLNHNFTIIINEFILGGNKEFVSILKYGANNSSIIFAIRDLLCVESIVSPTARHCISGIERNVTYSLTYRQQEGRMEEFSVKRFFRQNQ